MLLTTFKKLLRKFRFTSTLLDVYFVKKFYLDKKGWTLSRSKYRPLDIKGSALPWFTYSSISFLNNKIKKTQYAFEYGSGNSTLYFSDKVDKVISVESDYGFYDSMKPKLENRSNVEYLFRADENGKFGKSVTEYEQTFDIIIIDGADRINCARNSIESLKDDGIIIWDNSDREEYQEGYTLLLDQGFKRLDFFGHGPIGYQEWCTSIFYRQNNCFNI